LDRLADWPPTSPPTQLPHYITVCNLFLYQRHQVIFSLPKSPHLWFNLTDRTSIAFTFTCWDNLVLSLLFLVLQFLDRLV
jgi:hypothetical protein